MAGERQDFAEELFPAFSVVKFFAFCSVTLFFVWFLYRWNLFKGRTFPPGPIGLPIVGHIGILIRDPHKELVDLSKKYGKLFSLYFGSKYSVVATEYKIAKEILSHPSALARPEEVFGFIPGSGGFAGTSGTEWQEQRRFFVATMRNMRTGSGLWERMIKAHVLDFIEEVGSWQGKPTDPSRPVTISVASNNVALLIGRGISKKTDPKAIDIIDKVSEVLCEHFSTNSLNVAAPWLAKYLVRLRIGEYHKDAEILEEFSKFLWNEVQKHMDPKEIREEEDFIGSYLKETQKRNAVNNHHYFSVDNLLGHLILLFFAASDTTSASIQWLLVLMAAYPEVQKKVQQEIEEVIGRNCQASWDERKSLPYTVGVILEMERFVAINRILPPRISTETFQCGGYTIPKGSRILVNSWAIMHDPGYWDKPMDFIPERFIRNDGKDPSKTEGFSAFSFGRRNCPGDVVALMTIFIYFTNIMQKFTIQPQSGCTADLTDGPPVAIVSPVKQQLCFVERK